MTDVRHQTFDRRRDWTLTTTSLRDEFAALNNGGFLVTLMGGADDSKPVL